MRKKLFITLLILTGVAWAGGASAIKVRYHDSTQEDRSFAMTGDLKLTFDSGDLCFWETPADCSAKIPLGKIKSISFDSTVGLDDVVGSEARDVSISYDSRTGTVAVAAAATLEVYRLDGLCVLSAPVGEGGRLDVSALQPGVYIVKGGTAILKFVK